jgi:hypothetical protein
MEETKDANAIAKNDRIAAGSDFRVRYSPSCTQSISNTAFVTSRAESVVCSESASDSRVLIPDNDGTPFCRPMTSNSVKTYIATEIVLPDRPAQDIGTKQ